MRMIRLPFAWILFLGILAPAQEIATVNSKQAFALLKEPSTFLVDVRSVAEYVFVGHPEMAYNIPLGFWDERQGLVLNEHFIQDLKSRFQPEDKLIFLCQGGGRSLKAAQAAAGAGFLKVVNLSEGFDGRPDDRGYFTKEGWRNSGLPYTYKLDEKLAYRPAAGKLH